MVCLITCLREDISLGLSLHKLTSIEHISTLYRYYIS